MPIVIPQSAYPLTWPDGVRRTDVMERKKAPFYVTQLDANNNKRFAINNGHGIGKIRDELRRLGASTMMISSFLQLRTDGLPYADGPQNPGDVGVAVYWTRVEANGRLLPYCMPCDKWTRIADNLYAVGMSIEALRGMERWGCVSVEQAFAGFAALPPGSGVDESLRPWRVVFDIQSAFEAVIPKPDLLAIVRRRHREQIAKQHPDRGGDAQAAAEINAALAAAEAELV